MDALLSRVLLVDDDHDNLLLVQGLLSQFVDARYACDWASTYETGLQSLRHVAHDVCLLDYRLGGRDGLELLRQVVNEGCRVPIVILTGQADRTVDLQAMKGGAVDFLNKDGLTAALLERVLRFAIERRRAEEQRRRDEAHLRLVTQHLPAALWTTDAELRFTSSLGTGLLGSGLLPDALVGRTLFQHFQTQEMSHPVIACHLRALQGEPAVLERDWHWRTYQMRLEPMSNGNGRVVGTIGIALDITERRNLALGFRAAQEIQQRLLPQTAPQLPGFDIAGICRPAEATGGDFFDYVPMRDGCLGIVAADVSSHGFAPALIMTETRRLLRTLAVDKELADIVGATNQAVVEDTSSDLFVTLFFAQLNPTTNTVSYIGAGHEGYLLDGTGTPRKLASTAPPLGVVDGLDFRAAAEVSFEPDNLLVLLTDGFAEALGPDGQPFGIERTLSLVQSLRDRPSAEILDRVYRAVCDYCHPKCPHDDVTGVIVKRMTGTS